MTQYTFRANYLKVTANKLNNFVEISGDTMLPLRLLVLELQTPKHVAGNDPYVFKFQGE